MPKRFGHVIHEWEKDRVWEKRGSNPLPFNIMKDPRYFKMRNISTEGAKFSSNARLGKTHISSDILIRKKEAFMLASPNTSFTTPNGIIHRLLSLLCKNLFVCGKVELRMTYMNQFEIHIDNNGYEYLW